MSEFGIGRCPECHNKECQWNAGSNHIEGYEYLDNTCYSGLTAKDCKERIKEPKE